LGVPPPKNLAAQKHQNFGICDSIANISGREQDIVDRKTALETAITPLPATKFGELWPTNGEKFSTHSIDFFGPHISAHNSVWDCRRHVTGDVTAQRVCPNAIARRLSSVCVSVCVSVNFFAGIATIMPKMAARLH